MGAILKKERNVIFINGIIDFINWLYLSFSDLILELNNFTYNLIDKALVNYIDITNVDINLVLFSNTPILTVSLQQLIYSFFGIFYTVLFLVLVYRFFKWLFKSVFKWGAF